MIFRRSWIAGILWLTAVSAGTAWLWKYSLTAAPVVIAARDWPVNTGLKLQERGLTLVMFVHPECPCSRASLGELQQLVERAGGKLSPQVVFFSPEEKRSEWSDTPLWQLARDIPGVRTTADADGAEAVRFSAGSSGETFVYSATGRLLFHGGITAARGHRGDNDGRSAIEALADQSTDPAADPALSPTFGCPLRDTAVLPAPL